MSRLLCSLVRKGESIETCPGNDCQHEHGKQYTIKYKIDGKDIAKTYTCVKVVSEEWTEKVNKIMCQ